MQPKGLLNRIIMNYAEKRLFGYGASDDWSAVNSLQGDPKDLKLLGMYSGVAYRCINTISEAVAGQYVPYPYTLNAQGKKQTVANHPFWELLANPNPDLTYYQLIEGSTSFVEQFGEFFWYVVPGSKTGYTNGIKQIYLLRPDKMGIVVDKKSGEVIGYNYMSGNGSQKIPFTTEEIRHFMTFNPKNPYRGFSTVEAAANYIQTEEEVSRFTRNYFRNNAAMSGIINVSGKVGRESWNKFVRQWRERYQGTDNAGKVALVRDSQITFTPVGSSVSEMQLTELKKTTVDQILMMFRIPKGLFGMESDQGLGRASVETLEYIFAKWTIDNKLDRLDDFIEDILRTYYGKQGALQVSHENIIPDDKEHTLSMYNQGVDRWITRQEIRDANPDFANNKIPGSNQLFTLLNQIPIEDAGDSNAGSTSSNDDSDSVKHVKLTLKGESSKKKVAKTYNDKQKEAYRIQVEKNSEAYAKVYKKAFVKLMQAQKQRVLDNLSHLTGKAIGDDLIDPSTETQAALDAMTPLLVEIALQQGQDAMTFAGSDDTYSLSQSIRNALQKSTQRMSQNFTQETIDQLSETLAEGINEGDGIDDLAGRVSDVYDGAEGYRAERVARTESLFASNSATLDGYRQTGFVTFQEWYANPGACPFCEELDGTTVGIEDNFVNQGDSVDVTGADGSQSSYQADYSDVETPPLHPNCSCTIIPVTSVDGGDGGEE